jgi:hypothetical protein
MSAAISIALNLDFFIILPVFLVIIKNVDTIHLLIDKKVSSSANIETFVDISNHSSK